MSTRTPGERRVGEGGATARSPSFERGHPRPAAGRAAPPAGQRSEATPTQGPPSGGPDDHQARAGDPGQAPGAVGKVALQTARAGEGARPDDAGAGAEPEAGRDEGAVG